MQEQAKPKRPGNAILENCNRLILSGVNDVNGFDERAISLETDLGTLEIRGENMKIQSFDTVTGDMMVNGYIYALVYTKNIAKQSFIKRIFR